MATITVKQAGGGDYTTIVAALTAVGASAGAGADDIVEVYNGTYNTERVVNNNMPSGTSWTHPFTLKVASGNTATLSSFSGWQPIYLDTGGSLYAIIQGFIIDGATTDVGPGLVTLSGVSYVRVIDCEIKNANDTVSNNNHVYIGISADSHHIEIINNRIHGGASEGHGIYNEGSDNTLQYNHIYDIGGYGIHNYSNVPGNTPDDNIIIGNHVHNCGTVRVTAAGILVGIGSGNQCFNNVSYGNLGGDLDGGLGIAVTGDGAAIYNNTVYGNSWYGIDASSSNSAIIKNNIAFDNNPDIFTTGATSLTASNNVTSDPLFVHAVGGDFHLKAGSPAINAGIDVSLPFSGSVPDAGAFETVPIEWNSTTGLWAVRVSVSSLLNSTGFYNLLDPFLAPNGYCGYVKAGPNCSFGVRKLSTGVEVAITPKPDGGGKIFWACDSRYAIMAQRISQGKQPDYQDIGAVIFDTLTNAFIDFNALGVPAINLFHDSGGQKNTMLWVQNGRQIGAPWVGTDPVGKIRRITVTPTYIEYVLAGVNGSGQVTGFKLYQRTISLSTGTMGTITEIDSHTVTVGSPTQPDWY